MLTNLDFRYSRQSRNFGLTKKALFYWFFSQAETLCTEMCEYDSPARGESWRWNFSGYALTFPCIAWPFPLLGSARKNSPLSQRGEEKVTLTLRH